MNIALIGPYGAGKGTQAVKMVPKFNLLHISTGDLFREHLQNRSQLGLLIQRYLDQGELVPDQVADATMEEWLRVCDPYKGVLFDGFPRTIRQAEFLDKLLLELGRTLNVVFYLKAPDEELTRRLSERMVCEICHGPFHTTFNPFKTCAYQRCEGEHLHQREDDKPEKVRVRLQIFHQETERLVDYYEQAEKLVIVDAAREINQVHQAIVQAVGLRSH